MGTDIGNQTVSILYHAPGNSSIVNYRHKGITKTGIYYGGYLSIVDSSHALISAFICEICDASHQVRIETADAVNVSVTSATPYIVIRWTYTGSATNDYAEILAVATPTTYDLVVGKCIFTGGGALNGFSYSDTTYPRNIPNVLDLFLKVEPTGNSDLRVRIRAGFIHTTTGKVFVPEQTSDLFTVPTSDSKVYLVYINPSNGAVAIDSTGTAAVSPTAPGYDGNIILAEVTLSSTDTEVVESAIRDVRSFISRPIGVDDSTIEFSDGKLQLKTGSVGYNYLKDVYDSGWFAAVKRTQYVKTHSLGSISILITLLFAPDSGGSPDLTNVIVVQAQAYSDSDQWETGAVIQSITSTQLTIASGYTYLAAKLTGGNATYYATGHYRVLATRIA